MTLIKPLICQCRTDNAGQTMTLSIIPCSQTMHIGANLIPDSVFKPMSKNQNDDNDYLRLFSIVFFAVESDSGVKWSLKLVLGPKKEDLEA